MPGSIRPRGLNAAALVTLGALAIAGPACVVIGADQAKYVEREENRFAVSGRPDVSLSTFDGSIEIRTSDRPEVSVTIEKRAANKDAASQIEVHAEQSGSHVVVDVRLPRAAHMFNIGWSNTTAKLIVTLPAASNVEARSGDGAIDVERVTGAVTLRSGDGNIHGSDLSGDVRVHTGDGAVTLDQVSGALEAESGDGNITVAGRMTSVRVHTGDGAVTIRAAAGSNTDGDWNVTTGDGSIVFEVPDGFGAELDAHTGDGRIHMQDVTLSDVTGAIGKSSVRGRLGSGGHTVRLRTGDGSITLRRF